MKAMGFDRTIQLSEDEFGRDFLVRNVYDLLMTHDSAWSVRVALNGDWGSGKTSIAEMIGERARAEGHAVGWVFPWRVSSSKDVATALTATVLSALEEADFPLSAAHQGKRVVSQRLDFLKKLKGLNKFADVGLGVLEDANAFDIQFAGPIADQLRQIGKRLLIVIDDLDRCEPAFLPSLMLFMRTALDIPGFSFLAPFDSDVVAKTLLASNKAWTSADRFLEKVFDFRVPIPDLTDEQKRLFLASQLARSNIQVNDKALSAAAHLLPGTPRAIKALVRDIGMARAEFARRKPEELSWSLLVLATMLRATSLEFFRAYRREVDRQVDRDDGDRQKAIRIDLRKVWELVGQPDPVTDRRVQELVRALEDAARTAGVDKLRHTLHFTDEHEPVTLMEFENSLARWRQSGLATALSRPPLSDTLSPKEAPVQLASRAIGGYQLLVDKILATSSRESREAERREYIEEGSHHLDFAFALLPLLAEARADQRFDLCMRLFAIEADEALEAGVDSLQARALAILRELCIQSGDDWERYDAAIGRLSFESKAPAWNAATAAALRTTMVDRARKELLQRLQTVDGFTGVFKAHDNFPLLAQVFLDPSDIFWSDPANAPALCKADLPVVRENLWTMFEEVLGKVTSGKTMDGIPMFRRYLEQEAAHRAVGRLRIFLQSGGAVTLAWNACAENGSSFADLAIRRQQLIGLGAPLPEPQTPQPGGA